MSTTTANTADGHITGFGSKPYRSYVLTALLVIYILNFIDRGLLSVVAPQMKPELGISDTAFGLLTGFGFALLYTVVGIPLAQFAETRHRVWIMSVCVALWSLMTALCGFAAEVTIGSVTIGAFWILLACRVGVGIGEAGCTPPANSLIADYYPPKARSTALGYYAMGVTLGGLLANLIGGPITDAFGWRTAFFVLGLPGIAVAVILKLTVKEPPRGYTDPPGTIRRDRPKFSDGLKELASKPSFWTMTVAATIAAFCGYGISSFSSLFLNRSFNLTAGEAAVMINVPVALASAVGTLFTGWLAEKLSKRHPNAIAWLAGIGLTASVPFYFLAFTTQNLMLCLFGLVVGGAIKYGYLAAQYTIGQGVVSAQVRAVATAILLFVVNLLGYGLGPLFIGALSDFIFNLQVTDLGAADLTRKACEGAARAALAQAQQDVCAIAHPQSLQRSLLITSALYAVGGLFFFLTCRWLKRDMVAK
ncbi:MFS transporter [Phenylobacterium sp. J367]|uniref:spinster family MFS transporter n=1 Tax=Phenylobacterium sp. J367 TaxID=2898435 RepID=UPI002150C7FA|nr:MFS transporter [Phenylobacterium sp. J367]MCR5879176.1 MFS transporter [Phenylobacterium sp. J367]